MLCLPPPGGIKRDRRTTNLMEIANDGKCRRARRVVLWSPPSKEKADDDGHAHNDGQGGENDRHLGESGLEVDKGLSSDGFAGGFD